MDGRPVRGSAQFPGPLDGVGQFLPSRIIDVDEGSDFVGVIANACLRDRLAQLFFDQDGIGGGLNSVARPRLRLFVRPTPAASALMFVRHPDTIASPHGVHFAEDPPPIARHIHRPTLRRFVLRRDLVVMQPPPRINSVIGDADLFDFFQVEEPFAVKQRMQSHDANGRLGRRLRAGEGEWRVEGGWRRAGSRR